MLIYIIAALLVIIALLLFRILRAVQLANSCTLSALGTTGRDVQAIAGAMDGIEYSTRSTADLAEKTYVRSLPDHDPSREP
ncbi:hypothetical protein [Novilysobacter erysipheiresistens]|uniref:Uncharacterized protein n=1 Tax=Novilysobacter erysipheiresistens TaxID=1749332 RepID=A0ABU7Z221_9GAMM